MRKLNATLLNGANKEEAILKIKDDSFAVTTNDQLIKIPYSNIKSYNFDEENQVLSIVKFGGNPIELNIAKDKQLLELLNSITRQNKRDSNESIPNYENNNLKENERKLERNATIRDTDSKKTEVKQVTEPITQKTSNQDENSSDKPDILKVISGIISIIVLIIIFVNMCSNGGRIEGGYEAERYALQEIPKSVLTLAFEPDVTSNELKCKAKEKTDDEIILVKCTTTNKHIIDYYESETIWYAYQETADRMSHYRSINPDKDTALKNLRDKD